MVSILHTMDTVILEPVEVPIQIGLNIYEVSIGSDGKNTYIWQKRVEGLAHNIFEGLPKNKTYITVPFYKPLTNE